MGERNVAGRAQAADGESTEGANQPKSDPEEDSLVHLRSCANSPTTDGAPMPPLESAGDFDAPPGVLFNQPRPGIQDGSMSTVRQARRTPKHRVVLECAGRAQRRRRFG